VVNNRQDESPWRKATCSLGNSGCVELAPHGGGVAIRDSKHPDGPILLYTADEWRCFLRGAQDGEFNDLIP
jgi:hypothetical protein